MTIPRTTTHPVLLLTLLALLPAPPARGQAIGAPGPGAGAGGREAGFPVETSGERPSGSTAGILSIAGTAVPVATGEIRGLHPSISADSALDVLRPGQTVRIRLRAGERLVGALAAAPGDSLVLGSGADRISVERASIDSLWVRERSTVAGALVGGGVGLVASVGISTWLCSENREGFMCGDSPQAVVGSTAGATVLGGVVGHLIHRWPLLYARNGGAGVHARPDLRIGPGPSVGVIVTLP